MVNIMFEFHNGVDVVLCDDDYYDDDNNGGYQKWKK